MLRGRRASVNKVYSPLSDYAIQKIVNVPAQKCLKKVASTSLSVIFRPARARETPSSVSALHTRDFMRQAFRIAHERSRSAVLLLAKTLSGSSKSMIPGRGSAVVCLKRSSRKAGWACSACNSLDH